MIEVLSIKKNNEGMLKKLSKKYSKIFLGLQTQQWDS